MGNQKMRGPEAGKVLTPEEKIAQAYAPQGFRLSREGNDQKRITVTLASGARIVVEEYENRNYDPPKRLRARDENFAVCKGERVSLELAIGRGLLGFIADEVSIFRSPVGKEAAKPTIAVGEKDSLSRLEDEACRAILKVVKYVARERKGGWDMLFESRSLESKED